MIILPAIDMMGGLPVRLYQGEYESAAQVADDVLKTAVSFEMAGAEWIHMVDLDGAKTGKKENAQKIVEVAQNVRIPIEVGGGIRSMEDIEWYLDHGVARVILGTAAIENKELLKEAVAKCGEKIAVGIDCKNGIPCARGWLTSSSSCNYVDFAKELEQIGVSVIIVTDIAKDGTLQGPNLEMLKTLQENVSMKIIASGGVADLSHIEALAGMNLYGAITGKAVYSGTLDLKQAIACGKECHAE